MTIGPEPRTRIFWRSSRLGTGRPSRTRRRPCPGERLEELVEEPERVVRAGAGLRVVLHAARRHVEEPDALHRAVVEVHVGELRGAERRLDADPGLTPHREAVVLARDRDAA